MAFLLPHLSPGVSVVDCGCGSGGVTVQLSERVAPGFVCGFDLSAGAVQEAHRLASSRGNNAVRFSVASVYDSGLKPASFDIALFCGVLAHLDNPLGALRHAYGLLKPGGIVAAREPQKEGDWFGGTDCEAVKQVNEMYVEDIGAAGGDPFIGGRLNSMLLDAGFVKIEATPSYSPALSSVRTIGEMFEKRLKEPKFVEKVVARGKYSAADLESLAQRVLRWRSDPASICAISECTALGQKPG